MRRFGSSTTIINIIFTTNLLSRKQQAMISSSLSPSSPPSDSSPHQPITASSSGKPPTYAPLCVPPHHWSVTPLSKAHHAHYIATLQVDGKHTVQVMLNPTDSRGYRSIVFLACHEDPKSVLNRPFTLSEQMAVHKALAVVSQAYSHFGMIAQVELAGNNSHAFDPQTATTTIGAVEPCFLHGHVIGRGDPNVVFIGGSISGSSTNNKDGLTLGGPLPGQLFDMREGKRPWETASTAASSTSEPNDNNNNTMINIARAISEQLLSMKDEAAKHNVHLLVDDAQQ